MNVIRMSLGPLAGVVAALTAAVAQWLTRR